jgi:hypothetical protein
VAALIAIPTLRDVDLTGTSVTEQEPPTLRAAKSGAAVYVGRWEGRAATSSSKGRLFRLSFECVNGI